MATSLQNVCGKMFAKQKFLSSFFLIVAFRDKGKGSVAGSILDLINKQI